MFRGRIIRVRTVLRRPLTDRWNVTAAKAIVATPRVPNPRDEDQEKVMPERLTKAIDIEGDGSTIPEQTAKPYEPKYREFKITKGILEKYGHTPGCKGCEASRDGTDPRRHSDACREAIEVKIQDDEVLKARLNMRDVRLERESKEQQPAEADGVDVDDVIGDADAAGEAMAEEAMRDESNIVPPTPGNGTLDGSQQETTKKEEEKRGREDNNEEETTIKRRRLTQIAAQERLRRLNRMASEARLRERIRRKYPSGGARRKLMAMLASLEGTPQSRRAEYFDISNIIGALQDEAVSPHDESAELERWRMMYENVEFWDDMHEYRPLEWEKVVVARKLEMDFFKKMGVYKKVHRSVAKAMGCKVISTKWLDTNKGDSLVPNYRSRLVGREIKCDKRLDLFSATPPLETLKFMCSLCARGQGGTRPKRMAVIDIKRAYFYAPARRPIFIEIPVEDRDQGDEGMVGQLQLSLYGTRDAAQNWACEYTRFLKEAGFTVGRSSPCNFVHKGRGLSLTVHGDDFTVVGSSEELEWLGKKMKERYDLKMDVLGPDQGQVPEVRILNRILRWGQEGIEYEPDQRHAEKVVEELGLEKSKAVSTPCVVEPANGSNVMKDRDEEMSAKDASRYRAIAARVNYLAADRPDLLFAAKGVCKHMAVPRIGDWEALKRIGRYLKGKPRMVQAFGWADPGDCEIVCFADSDWAGDRSDMRSTSGGVVMWGGHCLKAWSTSQTTVALSSGEAELYAVTKAATQVAGMVSMAADFGLAWSGTVKSDSSAAIGIAHRDGLGGRCRHIRVQYLWIQGRIREGELDLKKVPGTCNPSDVMTKAVTSELMIKYLEEMGYKKMDGRADHAPRTS